MESAAARQIKRLRRTFSDKTFIRLKVFHDSLEDVFVVDNSGMPARVENREVDDAATVFRRFDALIFSQEEITQLAERQTSLLDFIDNLTRGQIDEPRNRARDVIERLKNARQVEQRLEQLEEELKTLNQEVDEIGRQLDAKTTVQHELKKHRAAQEAERYVEGLANKAQATQDRLKTIAEEMDEEPPPLGSRVDDFPDPKFFRQVEEQVSLEYQTLAQKLKDLSESLVSRVTELTSKHQDWPAVQQSITKAEQDFKTACAEKGLTTEEAEKIRDTEQQHRMKKAARQAKQFEKEKIARGMPDFNNFLSTLTQCWMAETKVRQKILDEISRSETMPRTDDGETIVRTKLNYAGDRDSFLKQWAELSPPRNTRIGRIWDTDSRDGYEWSIGSELYNIYIQSISYTQNQETIGNPVQWLELNWNNEESWSSALLEHKEDIAKVRKEKAEMWFALMLSRVPDAANLTLLRSDGTKAGSFQRDDLSTGQKNTAILSLLLARGTGPVLIDQPEDELDSEFLFQELVPMFRTAKNQRQLIIVTHNANIPVNADAELVYALEAHEGKGICRTQGGLDKAEVTKAVLDIMEGSENAFRRRLEKYHF